MDDSKEVNDLLDGETLEDEVPVVSYDVTSYGSDPDVEGLVRRIDRQDILIPTFQRDYVWRQTEASRFIESLLLGLPVPGVFFSADPISNKQLVIDGQQRLKSLSFFYNGFFNPRPGDTTQRVFTLTKVQKQFEGKTYKTLAESDRIRLDTSVIHATIVKQTSPPGSDTSMYHIFERLNSGGRRLTAQEMRLALYHGKLIDRITKLNDLDSWRKVFGIPHQRLKDQELILRFFAFWDNRENYSRPMSEFLNKYASTMRNSEDDKLETLEAAFRDTVSVFLKSIGPRPFRLKKTLNVAVFDSCMVGLAARLSKIEKPDSKKVKTAYRQLLKNNDYLEAVSRSTADDAFVHRRLTLAIEAFASC